MSILALPIYISHPSTLALAVALTWLWVMANSSLDVNITIVVTFLAGLLLFVSKLKFVFKIFDSKVQVTVFNYSLALCLLASGDVVTKKTDVYQQCHFSIFGRHWHYHLPSSFNMAS